MIKLLLLALGGATGTIARYGAAVLMTRLFPAFPGGTLLVNLFGSLTIGLLWGLIGSQVSENTRLFLFVGLLGGFTTFSAFSIDSVNLFQDGLSKEAMIYVFSSVVGGIALAYVGFVGGSALR
jgi:CrcB protein